MANCGSIHVIFMTTLCTVVSDKIVLAQMQKTLISGNLQPRIRGLSCLQTQHIFNILKDIKYVYYCIQSFKTSIDSLISI